MTTSHGLHDMLWRSISARGGYGSLNVPAGKNSTAEQDDAYANLPSQHADRKSSALVVNINRVGLIVCLLDGRGPSNISRFINAIHVYAIKRVLWRWSVAHVAQELNKRTTPLVANLNSPATVHVVVFTTGVVASSNHRPPCDVLGGFLATSPGMAMYGVGECNFRSPRASAAFPAPTPQCVGVDHALVATNAAATPKAFAAILQCRVVEKPLSCDIDPPSGILFHAPIIATPQRQEDPWRWN